jgi:hypothetical protein
MMEEYEIVVSSMTDDLYGVLNELKRKPSELTKLRNISIGIEFIQSSYVYRRDRPCMHYYWIFF